ncbi:MAG: glycosyltransferase [Planctomycetes bacterium]|nr:glycosyltransferase [Planctomycetota bacterium]
MADIICLGCVPWDYLKIAPQQTMKEMGGVGRVLYIERPRSIAGLVCDFSKSVGEWKYCFSAPREVAEKVYVITPLPAMPMRTSSLLANRITIGMAGKRALRAANKLGFKNPVFWNYLPQGNFLYNRLGESLRVYDVVDEYSAFPKMDKTLCERMERAAVEKAEIVFAISPPLVEKRKEWNRNTFLCPIGAETEMFFSNSDGEIPQALANLKRPVIGYYGAIDKRFGFELLGAVAESMKDATFACFGPVREKEKAESLAGLGNVIFPGPIPYEELPRYARHFDVCHLPYAQSEFNRYIFPNKTFEYLATGNPVVTTPVPALDYLAEAGALRIASGAEEYEKALRAALAEGRAEAEKRKEIARANSWAKRAEKMWRVVRAWQDGERDREVLARMVEP